MEPALGALRLDFRFYKFDEGHARVLARVLDAAPRAARIDIKLASCDYFIHDDEAGLLADILSSPGRAFTSPPQVHLKRCDLSHAGTLLRLARAGVCVASIKLSLDYVPRGQNYFEIAANAANTLTQLHLRPFDTVNPTTRLPALLRLILTIHRPGDFATDVPSLTALAPHLKEIEFNHVDSAYRLPQHGFGFEPRRFAQFVAAIQGVTRIRFGASMGVTLSQNENLGQLTALRSLRDLEISFTSIYVGLETRPSSHGPFPAPVVDDAVTNLPPLPPGLTRLAFSDAARMAFRHPLPGLRVLDGRGLKHHVSCGSFYWDGEGRAQYLCKYISLRVPPAVPSAAIAPNLHTLLIGYKSVERGDFDLWTLVAARTALRVVAIDQAFLLCTAPDGIDTTTTGFATLLAREKQDLVSIHTHDCVIEDGHQPAADNFLRAVERRSGRVCRAGMKECLFGMLHDGTDLWG